jgi:hypothetical protein
MNSDGVGLVKRTRWAPALSPSEAVQVERERACEERTRAARHARFAARVAGTVQHVHRQTVALHLAAAAIHDANADRIQQRARRPRRARR